MKKAAFILFLCVSFSTQAQAYDTGRTDDGVFRRILKVEGRGLLNAVGLPAELVRTPLAEMKNHRWLWPVTFLPRLITNVVTRTVSAVYDIVSAPFVLPFTDDITPLTDLMGLPDYPWQSGEEGF